MSVSVSVNAYGMELRLEDDARVVVERRLKLPCGVFEGVAYAQIVVFGRVNARLAVVCPFLGLSERVGM